MAKDFIHPSKKQWIQSGGDPELQELLPSLSSEEQTYLQMITSRSYEQLVSRLTRYTGIEPEAENLPRIVMLVYQSLQEVVNIESEHKKELEQLALDFIFSFDEFKIVKEAVENGEVSFQLSLKQPDIRLPVQGEGADESGLDDSEEMNLALGKGLEGVTPTVLRKRLADLLIQGAAVQKTYAFHMVDKELESIDPKLTNLYGILACAAQLGYWAAPEGIESAAASGGGKAGAEEVIPTDDAYVVRVQAICFPYLVHELVKGIYSWISTKEEFSSVPSRGVGGETPDIIVGPEISKAINQYVPSDKQYLISLVNKLVLDLDKEEIHQVLLRSEEGRRIMQGVLRDAQDQWDEYQRSKIDYEYGDEEKEEEVEEKIKIKEHELFCTLLDHFSNTKKKIWKQYKQNP